MRKMEDDELGHLYRLFPFFLSPQGNNFEIKVMFVPFLDPCPDSHVLSDTVTDAGFQNLYSICCTSQHTPSPIVYTSLVPSDPDYQD